MAVRFPTDSNRMTVIGRTGSGKTVAGLWHLSERSYDKMPWVIINSKGDPLIAKISKIPGVHSITLDVTPKKPGLYIVRPLPDEDDDALNAFFKRIWARGNTGIYIDEGYMIPKNGTINWILTQGRSKRIPVITLAQRPVFLSKFTFTESEFFQVFELSHDDDKETLRKFVPYDVVETLPEYHSLWFDVGKKTLVTFGPVPDETAILTRIRDRVAPRVTYI